MQKSLFPYSGVCTSVSHMISLRTHNWNPAYIVELIEISGVALPVMNLAELVCFSKELNTPFEVVHLLTTQYGRKKTNFSNWYGMPQSHHNKAAI